MKIVSIYYSTASSYSWPELSLFTLLQGQYQNSFPCTHQHLINTHVLQGPTLTTPDTRGLQNTLLMWQVLCR